MFRNQNFSIFAKQEKTIFLHHFEIGTSVVNIGDSVIFHIAANHHFAMKFGGKLQSLFFKFHVGSIVHRYGKGRTFEYATNDVHFFLHLEHFANGFCQLVRTRGRLSVAGVAFQDIGNFLHTLSFAKFSYRFQIAVASAHEFQIEHFSVFMVEGDEFGANAAGIEYFFLHKHNLKILL